MAEQLELPLEPKPVGKARLDKHGRPITEPLPAEPVGAKQDGPTRPSPTVRLG